MTTTNLGPAFEGLLAECRAEEEAAEALALAEDVAAVPAPERFRIDSAERAAWAVNKILGYDEEEARLDAQHAAMKKDIQDRRASFLARFGLELEDWARANPPKKGKTIKTLAGNLSFRTVAGGLRVTDKAAALEWAKAHRPELVKAKTIEALDVDAVKDACEAMRQACGEMIPGVEDVEDREVFEVKPVKTKGDE